MSIEEGRLTYFVFKKYDFAAEKGAVCATRRRPSGALPTWRRRSLERRERRSCKICEELGTPAAVRMAVFRYTPAAPHVLVGDVDTLPKEFDEKRVN
jgi:hypothetical protein